ncbi:MAG: hypothetical protein KDD82_22535 [Planctomycetes bacterium]|nr:hypothetical protein [Planctomycetota bacterium]
MHILIGALVGAAVAVGVTLLLHAITGRRLRLRDVLLSAAGGALGGAVITGTLGVGAAVGTTRTLGAFGLGGAVASGSEQAGRNVLDERPVLEGVGRASAIGGATGVAFPVVAKGAGKVVQAVARRLDAPVSAPVSAATTAAGSTPAGSATAPPSRGIKQILLGEEGGGGSRRAPRVGGKAYASIHPPAPAWLQQRFARTVDEVWLGRSGPKAETADVKRFLEETYEHVNEVNALVKALGGRPRPIPARAGPDEVITGVHDFGERASVRRVEELVESLRKNPVTDRDGNQLEVPEWLIRLPREARAAGEATIDVGKASPHVAAGLGRTGPPDPFALRLHNLSAHHAKLTSKGGAPSNVLIEEVADMVNAMRQPRIYRPEPMPFGKIEAILDDMVAKGQLPEDATPLIRRALEAQRQLEVGGQVNPYHRIGAELEAEAPYTGLASVDPRDLGRLGTALGASEATQELDPFDGY